jgi:hypothetical protein
MTCAPSRAGELHGHRAHIPGCAVNEYGKAGDGAVGEDRPMSCYTRNSPRMLPALRGPIRLHRAPRMAGALRAPRVQHQLGRRPERTIGLRAITPHALIDTVWDIPAPTARATSQTVSSHRRG